MLSLFTSLKACNKNECTIKNQLLQILNNWIGNIKQFYHKIMGWRVIGLTFCNGIFQHFWFRHKVNRKPNFKYTLSFMKLSYILNKQHDCCTSEEILTIVRSFFFWGNELLKARNGAQGLTCCGQCIYGAQSEAYFSQ